MRFSSSLLLALPALAVAEQVPLVDRFKDAMGWLNKATAKAAEYVPSSIPTPKSPVDAGAAKAAEYVVEHLNMTNWRDTVQPSPAAQSKGKPDQWMILLTGGNKTCYGMCGNVTKAWNKAVTLLAPMPDRPHLGYVDCEEEKVLCNSWNSGPPMIFHMQIPQPLSDQSTPATTVRRIRLNRVNITATNIVEIHTKKAYEKIDVYEGAFHPFDGWVHQYGLAVPYGYVIMLFSMMPSWLPMIAVSFFSRSFIGGRMQPNRGANQGRQ